MTRMFGLGGRRHDDTLALLYIPIFRGAACNHGSNGTNRKLWCVARVWGDDYTTIGTISDGGVLVTSRTAPTQCAEQTPTPPGYMVCNNLLESGDYIDVGQVASDSSVHLLQQTATLAWIVASGT